MLERELLAALRERHAQLRALLKRHSDHWGFEDPIYRLDHQSFKVYALQDATIEIANALQSLLPKRALHEWFQRIVRNGVDREFSVEENKRWLVETCPIVEGFFHARFFLEMTVRYARRYRRPPKELASGWAAILCLYRPR